MKMKINIEKEFDIKLLKVSARVRYWEDSTFNGIDDSEDGTLVPCKINEFWEPIIDIEKGIIINWEQGKSAEIHYKVCDCCGWELLDENNKKIIFKKDGYVPSTLSPKDNGFGDYIIMDIDEFGQIKDWKFDIKDFTYKNEH